MRILNDWQYRYIEKSLFGYNELQNSELETEKRMLAAIEEALCYFSGSSHEIMMREFYFKRSVYCKTYTNAGHYRYVCFELLHTEESNGYVIKREIIYKVAMFCYELGVFKSGASRFLN
jgi:hypothetical protein